MAILLKHATTVNTFCLRDFLVLCLHSLLNFSISISREKGMKSQEHQEKVLIQVTEVFRLFTEILLHAAEYFTLMFLNTCRLHNPQLRML